MEMKLYRCAHCGNIVFKVVDKGVPVVCCGQCVEPGDILLGDADGVIVIPSGEAEALYEEACLAVQRDREKTEQARHGLFDRNWVDGELSRKGCEIIDGMWR